MSLDRVSLTPDTLRLLYPNSLVAMRRGGSPAGMPRFLGGNERRVLILVEDPSSAYLDETAFAFLLTILGACRLSMEHIALVNVAGTQEARRAALPELLQSRVVLAFGIGGDRPLYQVVESAGRSFLWSASLAEIASDRTAKGRLWGGLKQLFQL